MPTWTGSLKACQAERVRTIMRRYLELQSVPALLVHLKSEGILTKVQVRASGPHRGGIPFARGSLFHLLKNPIYRGKIVHKGQVYDGEHEPIVDEDLWDRVQQALREKAPARKRPANDPQRAMLQGLLFDPQGRPMVPTYGSNGTRRYTYYVSRKDLTRKGDPRGTRFRRGEIEEHVVQQLSILLNDEHALRRLSGCLDGAALRTMFSEANRQAQALAVRANAVETVRAIVAAIHVTNTELRVEIRPAALGLSTTGTWTCIIPKPAKRPFREARLRMDAKRADERFDEDLITLLSEAMQVQRLVLRSPELSLSQLGKREGRCRAHLGRLLRLSWLSPRIVEAIADGTQPKSLTRQKLLSISLPLEWDVQERLLGMAV